MAERRRRFGGAWIVLAVAAAVIPGYLTVLTVGECRDSSDPALSVCTSGPALGETGTIVVWALWAAFATWCIGRALTRPRRRRPGTVRRPPVRADGGTPRIGAHTTVEVPVPPQGSVRLEYAPSRNGRPDAGEVVWAWVPFQEDPTYGKDRPLLIIAPHDAQHMLAMKLTSRPRDGARDHLAIGSGPWDAQGRPSWLDIEQVYRVHRSGIRREAAPVGVAVFDRVSRTLSARYGWIRADQPRAARESPR